MYVAALALPKFLLNMPMVKLGVHMIDANLVTLCLCLVHHVTN